MINYKSSNIKRSYINLIFVILLDILILVCCSITHLNLQVPYTKSQVMTKQEKTYNKIHKSSNNPMPRINYKKLSNNNHLHVDSYDVKDNKRIYYDSLLMRYGYYYHGNSNLVTNYVGSHGIIGPTDKITPSSNSLFSENKIHVALSNGAQYSSLNLNLYPLVDYANRFRIRNIYYSLENQNNPNYMNGPLYRLMKLSNLDPESDNDDCIFYFIKDCAPNECAGLSDFLGNFYDNPPTHYSVPQELKEKHSIKWCAPIFMNEAQAEDYGDGDSINYSDWQFTYLNGKLLSKPLKQPKDPTRKFTRGIISTKVFNSKHGKPNVLYSNGNAYFLQLMYKNYENMSNDNPKSCNLNSNYKFIDAYRRGWHINPIMFNNFVRQPNKYNSPYLFNYTIGGDMAWQNIKPMSQTMLNYIEHQDYNLPCNYDNNHYYYRTIEGTLVRDDNIKSVNNGQNVFIMGTPTSNRKMPTGKNSFKNTAPYLKQMKKDNRNPHPSLALSNSIQYSNLQLNNQKLIDYANKFRARNIDALESADGYMINGKYHAIIEPQVDPYADKQIQYYYIQDCAPSESYDLNNFIRTTQNNSIRYRVPEDAKEEAYVKWCVPIYRERFTGKFVDEGGNWVKEYLDGKSLFNKLKVPTDQTSDFQVNSLKIDDLYNSQRKTFYSNGNSYFLQQMYENMQHIKNYHLISAYNSNWYLSPIIFNTFVRNTNQYSSPYLFNYWQNNQTLLGKAKPNTQEMTSFLEQQSNNLPANYDQNHYYYRTLEGTLIRDDNIKSINNNQSVLIMGNPHDDRSQIGSKKYYQSELEYDYAKKYQGKPEEASKFLNFKRCDGGFEPLWKIGLENSYKIGKYHPGEILKFADNLSNNQISNYYVVQNGQKLYIPTYNIDGQTCFKVRFTPQEPFGEYVRAQDIWLLNGNHVHSN